MKKTIYQELIDAGLKRMISLLVVFAGLIVLHPDLYARDLITGHPVDVTECENYSKEITFTVVAPDATSWQWQMWTGKEWRNIADIWDKTWPGYAGDQSDRFTIQFSALKPLTTFWDGAAFRCYVSNKFAHQYSNAAYINVLIAPGITSHPRSTEKQVGDDVSFSVSTTGSNPKTYQWQKFDGKFWLDISGATDRDLVIKDLETSDAGDYRVIVTNDCGSVTSKAATLTVIVPFKITDHPDNVEKCDDYKGDVSFEVVAQGGVLVYQWQVDEGKGFVDIDGEVSSVLTIPFDPKFNGFAYRCWVGDKSTHESDYSNAAFLYVKHPPNITVHPADVEKNEGESATFSVSVTGTTPISYTWQVNTGSGWTDIPEFSGSSYTYTINSVSGSMNGNQYRCVVTNECGTDESNPATLTVNSFAWPQGWFYQNSGTGKHIYDVQMVSESEAFAAAYTVTGQEKILHTTDGGETWDTIQSGFTYAWRSLHFETTELGWIAGSSRIAKTENGGVDWSQVYISGQYFYDIFFTDANNGWAVSYTGGIYNTSDGGDNWDPQPSGIDGPLKSVFFVDSDTGWAVGDQYQAKSLMLFTHDGGATWFKKDLGSLAVDFEDSFFVNNQVGYVVGASYTMLKTIDGGDTWTELSLPNYWTSTVHFVHPDTGWVCGSSGRIYMTNNGGTTWYLQETEAVGSFYGMHFYDSDNGLAVGQDGIINRTAFGGCFLPRVNLYEDRSLCTGFSTVLVADTFDVNYPTFSWSTGSSDGSIEVGDAGVYSVEVSNICGDVTSDDVEISLYPLPPAYAGEDDTMCAGESVQLLATGGIDYYWSPEVYLDDPAIQNPVATPPVGNTEFIVNVTDMNGCSQKDTVNIRVWAIPTSSFSSPVAVCGETNALITYTGTATSGDFTWGFDNGDTISGTGEGPYTISWDTIGTKTVSLTVEENGCVSNETTADISVFAIPVSDFSVQESVCGDGLVFITYNGVDSAGADYMWDFAGAEIVTGSEEGPYQVKWNSAGIKNISLKVDENNCVDSTDHDMIVYAIPVSTFDAPEFVCGTDSAEITFTGSAADTANFFWDLDGGSGAPDMDPFKTNWATLGAKTISLVITEAGCESDTTKHVVSVNQVPTSEFDIQDAVCGSDTVRVSYTGNASDTADFTWSFGEPALGIGTGQGPYRLIYDREGIRKISLSVLENGCYSDTTEAEVMVDFPYAGLEICLVTVDIETGYNMVIWERPADDGIAAFNVYRESTFQGTYDLLADMPFDSLSVYVDTTSQPDIKSHKYKISVVDTCGNESKLSDWHKTMLLTSNLGQDRINLSWQEYETQGGGFGFVQYLIYRGDAPNKLEIIDSIPSDNVLYPDINPPNKRMYYRIAGVKATECAPAIIVGSKKAGAGPYSHSVSNMEDNRLQTSVNDQMKENYQFSVYPNPFSDVTQLSYSLTSTSDIKIEVYNLLGARVLELVSEIQSPGDYRYDLKASDLGVAEGIFYIRHTVGDNSMVKKVILTR